jgi:hypothetical protein
MQPVLPVQLAPRFECEISKKKYKKFAAQDETLYFVESPMNQPVGGPARAAPPSHFRSSANRQPRSQHRGAEVKGPQERGEHQVAQFAIERRGYAHKQRAKKQRPPGVPEQNLCAA